MRALARMTKGEDATGIVAPLVVGAPVAPPTAPPSASLAANTAHPLVVPNPVVAAVEDG